MILDRFFLQDLGGNNGDKMRFVANNPEQLASKLLASFSELLITDELAD